MGEKDEKSAQDFHKIRKNETKEEKKLRKKLVKIENKERREEKKRMKNMFREEKVLQQKQIADCNKVIRYGMSVKEM